MQIASSKTNIYRTECKLYTATERMFDAFTTKTAVKFYLFMLTESNKLNV